MSVFCSFRYRPQCFKTSWLKQPSTHRNSPPLSSPLTSSPHLSPPLPAASSFRPILTLHCRSAPLQMFSCVHPHLVHIDAVELLLIYTDHSKGHPGRAEHPHTATFDTYLFFCIYVLCSFGVCFVVFSKLLQKLPTLGSTIWSTSLLHRHRTWTFY